MAAPHDVDAIRRTTSLMNFMADITDAIEKDPVRDILSREEGTPRQLVWLDQLPEGVQVRLSSSDDVLLRLRPPRSIPSPDIPQQLEDWIDPNLPRGCNDPEPVLRISNSPGIENEKTAEVLTSIERSFERWLTQWRQWAEKERLTQKRRHLYEQLEDAAKAIEQQDDEFELVLASGLICWQTPDGERIRRHLLCEPALPKLNRDNAEITVSLPGGKRRCEDRELFADQEGYQPDRAKAARLAILDGELPLLDERLLTGIENWFGTALTHPVVRAAAEASPKRKLPEQPEISVSPALVLRPRSRALLAETYRRIADALSRPDAQVPVALAQLIMDTEPLQRHRWLTQQGAATSDVLGVDPLFPLSTNDEQKRVLDLLRTENCVVVQGPPGTGKTHTIANLVSALLARGLRVLVTSQKDQALRVLREKIPDEMRRLCVLLAGGNKDAARELEQSLDALSEAITSPKAAALIERADRLAAERHGLKQRSAVLNDQIARLRAVEDVRHQPVVPGYSEEVYLGPLTDIVREVKRHAAKFEWIPPVDPRLPDRPPLSTQDMVELLALVRADIPARRIRADQQIPGAEELPNTAELTDILASEKAARLTAHEDTSALTQQLAAVDATHLHGLQRLHQLVVTCLHVLGFGEDGRPSDEQRWSVHAIADRLAGRKAGLWGHLLGVQGEAARLQQRLQAQGVSFVIELPSVQKLGVGRARGLLNVARRLRDHLAQGKKLRTLLPKPAVQKEAVELLELVRVDGVPPLTVPHLDAVLERLEAEVAAAQLVGKWTDAGVEIRADRLAATLSELCDNEVQLASMEELTALQGKIKQLLGAAVPHGDLITVTGLLRILDAVPAALRYVELELARTQVAALESKVRTWAQVPRSCPELGLLLQAIGDRDLEAYRGGVQAIDLARIEKINELRRAQLTRTLRGVHPQLCDLLERTAHDEVWDERVSELAAAWAWSKAAQFVQTHRNAEKERRLQLEFDQVEDGINRVTAELAAVQALHACLDRMSDTHASALRTYRELMGHVGGGGGSKVREFRKAARAAMDKAKYAVPAWVVPLPNLLDNITPEPNAFDVVIVDEASQAGIEQLFLLWMAPRVIVVGDDKQCSPGASRMGKLDAVFAHLREHLRDVDEDIRMNFSSKSNLYGMLSARSGKDAVIRLREHFRCMPEIINWSSNQFYGDAGAPGLVPLRERRASDLEPLKVVFVEGGYLEGRDSRRRNPTEAKRIVGQLVECLDDPRYVGKSFGVVVLPGAGVGQVRLLEHEINAAIPPEQRAERKIRVGTPPDFQGDERDVILLSMVVVDEPIALGATWARQSFNVAASRAKDQMWLFSSVPAAKVKNHDLRSSLLGYMLSPPSVFGTSPELESVSATTLQPPFESVLEQRIFREIRGRGYHVVPQHKIGSRALDLVVVGKGGRLAVECDGHRWHTSPEQQISDARRDRSLRRMGWEVIRIRESEFEFDPERETAALWQRLAERGIRPHDMRHPTSGTWAPVDLSEADDEAHGGDEA